MEKTITATLSAAPANQLFAWHKEKLEVVEIKSIDFTSGIVRYFWSEDLEKPNQNAALGVNQNAVVGTAKKDFKSGDGITISEQEDPIDKFSFKKKLVKKALGGWSSKGGK